MRSVSESLTRSYDACPESVGLARSAVAEFAARAGASTVQLDAIRLATSEAVTNAVLHAYRSDPGRIELTVGLAGAELWLQVADDGVGVQPSDRAGLGLGLGLIEQVCEEMAVVPRSSGGTEVRVRFDLAAQRTTAGSASSRGRLAASA